MQFSTSNFGTGTANLHQRTKEPILRGDAPLVSPNGHATMKCGMGFPGGTTTSSRLSDQQITCNIPPVTIPMSEGPVTSSYSQWGRFLSLHGTRTDTVRLTEKSPLTRSGLFTCRATELLFSRSFSPLRHLHGSSSRSCSNIR